MMETSRSSQAWDQLAEAVIRSVGICRIALSEEFPDLARRLRSVGATIAPLEANSANRNEAAVLFIHAGFENQTGELNTLAPSLPNGSIFVVANAGADETSKNGVRDRIEAMMIELGLRKHPASTRLFGFEGLGKAGNEIWALFEKTPNVFSPDERTRLLAERDLHADMLREAGVRSDAHIVRYQLAADLVRPDDTVLDAACGLGYGSHVLASLSLAARITSIDGSEWAIEYARRQYGSPRTRFDLGTLPGALASFEDSSVDCIVSLETLEHVEKPEQLLDEFLRILKPSGRIVVSVPNDWADETGQDPSPYHLQVYDWARLSREIGQRFSLEKAWRLIASGCKTGSERKWVARPRLLQQVDTNEASGFDAEWWVAAAMKSPVGADTVPYKQTVHGDFRGKTHLVDFETHYNNPWLVHGLVEIPWRMQDRRQLISIADSAFIQARAGSADRGAALAVQGWRLFEDAQEGSRIDQWLGRLAEFRSAAGQSNPHIVRWLASLGYLEARLYEQMGKSAKAESAFSQMVKIDVLQITPTLGTKSVDAFLRMGILQWVDGREKEGRESWRNGVASAEACLKEDWVEFLGDIDRPFAFSLNDAIETLDLGVRCALALRATSAGLPRPLVAVQLGELRSRSLRSAVRSLERQLSDRENELGRTAQALDEVQSLAIGRAGELNLISTQLAGTQAAFDDVQKLAWTRSNELSTLTARLEATERITSEAQTLAHTRSADISRIEGRLQQTQDALEAVQGLALERARELSELQARLSETQEALEQVQKLAVSRYAEIQDLARQLTRTSEALETAQGLAVARYGELRDVQARLTETQEALEQAQELAVARFGESGDLQMRLSLTQRALEQTQELAITRFAEIQHLGQQLKHSNDELVVAQGQVLDHVNTISDRDTRLRETEEALENAQGLASSRANELETLNRNLTSVHTELLYWKNLCNDLVASLSWRLTSPLRTLKQFVRRFSGPRS